MDINVKTIGYEGKDAIIFSESFNVYENELIIADFLGYNFKFIFENKEPQEDQADIVSKPTKEKEITITLSKKFRNSLGSISEEKLVVLNTDDERKILFSIFGQKTGNDNLHITINFYLR